MSRTIGVVVGGLIAGGVLAVLLASDGGAPSASSDAPAVVTNERDVAEAGRPRRLPSGAAGSTQDPERADMPPGRPVPGRERIAQAAPEQEDRWRDDVRDPRWAAPMERALEEVTRARVEREMPGVTWAGARCSSRSCRITLEAEVTAIEEVRDFATLLVTADEVRTRVGGHEVTETGRARVEVSVLFEGEHATAEAFRAAQAAVDEEHPEILERFRDQLAARRRSEER